MPSPTPSSSRCAEVKTAVRSGGIADRWTTVSWMSAGPWGQGLHRSVRRAALLGPDIGEAGVSTIRIPPDATPGSQHCGPAFGIGSKVAALRGVLQSVDPVGRRKARGSSLCQLAASTNRRMASAPLTGKSFGPVQLTSRHRPSGASASQACRETAAISCADKKYRTSENTIRSNDPSGQSRGLRFGDSGPRPRAADRSRARSSARSDTSSAISRAQCGSSWRRTPVAQPTSRRFEKCPLQGCDRGGALVAFVLARLEIPRIGFAREQGVEGFPPMRTRVSHR